MATAGHGKAARIYYDGYSLTQYVSKASQEVSASEAEYTSIEDTSGVYLQGKITGKVSADGFLDVTATTGFDATMYAALVNGEHYWTAMPTGTAALAIAYMAKFNVTSQARPYDQADVIRLNVAGTITDSISRGKVLLTPTAATTTGGLTGQNVGTSASTDEVVAHVLLVAASGSGSVTVAIQESSDNGAGDAYATISGMSGSLTAVGQATRLTFSGATETWKRPNVTALSGFTSVTLLVTIGQAVALP